MYEEYSIYAEEEYLRFDEIEEQYEDYKKKARHIQKFIAQNRLTFPLSPSKFGSWFKSVEKDYLCTKKR
jgi:hypothetical protein